MMNKFVKEYNMLIAKRLTAILVAVVFVLGMMYMPAEIFAVETDAVDNAVVTDTTGTSDEAVAPETEPAGAEEGVTSDTGADTATEETTGTEEEPVEASTEKVVEELNDALTVDLDSIDEKEYDGFIYKLEDDVTKKEVREMENAIDNLDGSEGQEVEEVIKKELYTADSIETIAEVASAEQIEYIEPNYIARAMGTDDPYYARYGWYLEMINAPYIWEKEMLGNGVTVAVLDSGVEMDHPDFEATDFTEPFNAIKESEETYNPIDITDDYGHGTAVTGIIAATANNQKGMTGIMPEATVMPIKVLDGKTGSVADVVRGIDHASDYGADVINISAGITSDSSSLKAACQRAAARGTIIVAAAGNDYNSRAEYPASYDTVVSVASIESDGTHSDFSNYNQFVAVSAPGNDICVPWNNSAYYLVMGTSFSAPQVSAMAVMIKQLDPTINYAGFMKIIAATSTDKGAKGFDPYFGYGLMNLKRAYDYMAGDISMYDISLSGTSFTYNGGVKTPSVTVKKANKAIAANYYRTTYAAGRANVGTYKVTVTGINGYTGTKTLSFNINPPLVKGIKAPKRGKGKLTVRWKAMSKNQKKKTYKNVITGYQVRVSTSSNFANAKYASVKGIAKTSKTVKGLKRKTTYYVQYRSYKTVGSATYYSNWSGTKRAKTK